jgi:hypothetical protein
MTTSLIDPKFKQNVKTITVGLKELIALGTLKSADDTLKLAHHFTSINQKYGCGLYARELFIPKGSVIIGKIHKQHHLNIVLKGKISVVTETGKKYFEAPCIFDAPPGGQKVGYAEEDTIWVNIHLTEHLGEDKLEALEAEVIASSYEALENQAQMTLALE